MKRLLAYSEKNGNKYVKVSDQDYNMLKEYRWNVEKSGHTFYASTKIKGKKVRMHRMIMHDIGELQVDHINRNGLDNRRENLRKATKDQNRANSGKMRDGVRRRYKGVHFHKGNDLWVAVISIGGKNKTLGYFKTAREAAVAYNKAALFYHKEFAYLNKII